MGHRKPSKKYCEIRKCGIYLLGGQSGQSQVVRYGITSHGASEYQQDRGKNRRFYMTPSSIGTLTIAEIRFSMSSTLTLAPFTVRCV